MIIDRLNVFSLAQAITVTAPSTDVIPLSPGARDIGAGTRLRVALSVLTAADAGTGVLTVALQGAPDNAGSPGTYEDLAISPPYTAAQLTLGQKLFPIDWPAKTPLNTLHAFLRLNFTVATGPFAGLVVFAGLVFDREDRHAYPSGFAVAN